MSAPRRSTPGLELRRRRAEDPRLVRGAGGPEGPGYSGDGSGHGDGSVAVRGAGGPEGPGYRAASRLWTRVTEAPSPSAS